MSLIVGKNLTDPRMCTKTNVLQDKKNQVGFGGISDVATSFIKVADTNDLVNYVLLDTVSMIAPRTIIDGSRNPYAGMETLARESFGAVSMCILPGFLAMGLANLAGKFNNPTGVKTNLFARNELIDHLYEGVWTEAKKETSEKRIESYLEKAFESLNVNVGNKAVGGTKNAPFLKNAKGANGKILDPKDIIDKMKELITHSNPENSHVSKIAEEIANAVGERTSFSVKTKGKDIGISADHFVRDVVALGREIFNKYDLGNMSEALKENLKKSDISEGNAMEKAVKRLKMTNTFKNVATFGVIAGLCFSFQFINRAITKAKTGKEGFVGYSDFGADDKKTDSKDKSTKINKSESKVAQQTKQDDKKPKLSFKGGWIDPTFTGPYAGAGFFRGVYPLTIVGRLAAARDGNEFRETLTRDTLGYLNWLVLGGVTAKLVGDAVSGGMLIKGQSGNGLIGKTIEFFKAGIMSHHDIEAYVTNLKRQGSEPLIEQAKKILKTEFIETNKGNLDKIGKAFLDNLNNRKTASWIAGFAWSTAMLGIIVPKYNAYVTEKKRKAQLAAQQQKAEVKAETPVNKNVKLEEAMNKLLKKNSG